MEAMRPSSFSKGGASCTLQVTLRREPSAQASSQSACPLPNLFPIPPIAFSYHPRLIARGKKTQEEPETRYWSMMVTFWPGWRTTFLPQLFHL